MPIRQTRSPLVIGQSGLRLQAATLRWPDASVHLWQGRASIDTMSVYSPVGTTTVAAQWGYSASNTAHAAPNR